MKLSKLLCLLLATLMLAGCSTAASAPAASDEASAQVANPVHQEADYNSLLKAVPDVLMADAPYAAQDVAYSWIEGTPVIAQITFTLDGCSYTYRGAAASDRNNLPDISGVNEDFDSSVSQTAPDSANLSGGDYTLYYKSAGTAGKAVWYYAPTECQYCVYSPDGANVAQGILTVVDQVMPLSEVHLDDLKASGSVTGATVVSFEHSEVTVNTTDGKTMTFSTELLTDVSVQAGDVVDITYNDYYASYMIALSITENTSTAAAESHINGSVYSFTDNSVFISTDSNIVYGFNYDSDTKFSGESTELRAGNSVTVYYDGDAVYAKEIKTNSVSTAPIPTAPPATGGGDPSQMNKQLTGTVTNYDSYDISVYSVNGNNWTFRIGNLTSITGDYYLDEGCQVRITYDGYASNHPIAKKIQVLSDSGYYDPAPASPYTVTSNTGPAYSTPVTPSQPSSQLLSASGTMVSMMNMSLVITETSSGSQRSFQLDDSTNIVGMALPGAPVTVTYYSSQMEGDKVAQSVVFG